MLARLRHTGADPAAAGHIAPQHKVRRIGEVVLVLELFCELTRHLDDLVVHGVPFHLVKVHRQAEVHGEGDAVVVDPRVEQEAAGGFTLAVPVDTLRLFVYSLVIQLPSFRLGGRRGQPMV